MESLHYEAFGVSLHLLSFHLFVFCFFPQQCFKVSCAKVVPKYFIPLGTILNVAQTGLELVIFLHLTQC
jgi:hypothetical protein